MPRKKPDKLLLQQGSQGDMPNTLAAWLTYLESLHPKTIALGLERVAQVKLRLNLQPHLLHYNERVRIAKQQVSDAELCN